ncbi:MAG: glycosyltransferase [Sphingobacteriaceae bacterium]|nr:MAG: glycosyltransferase [Sphingobacteriaceae bacterium]
MELLFISHKHPPSTGGMEKQNFELVERMRKYARVHTIIHEAGTSKISFFLSLNRRIKAMCRKHPGISVIHYNDGLMAAVCLKHKGYGHLKRTVTIHGLDIVFPNRIYRDRIVPTYKNFDRIFAVSRATAQACIERGIPPEKITVISNGVDASIADCLPRPGFYTYMETQYNVQLAGKKMLVCMGRAVKRKGFSWFISNVVPKLKGDFMLLIIGPYKTRLSAADRVINYLPPKLNRQVTLFLGWPSDEQNIRNLLRQQDINGKAAHLGRLPFDDIQQILMAADAFVMPNIPVNGDIEGFGLVALEACLCGTKVFASNIEGVTDVVTHNKNGYLMPAGDARKWVNALNILISDAEHYTLQPNEIKAYSLERFGWDKMVQEYLQCFKQLTDINTAILQH